MNQILIRIIAGCLLPLFFGLTSCSSENEASIDSFLQENDPSTKATRDRWIAAIDSQERKLKDLQRSSRKYESESAQNEFAREISSVEAELERLKAKLRQLDEKVEMAMLAHDFERADAAGMNSREAKEVLESSETVLEKAEQLNSDIRDSMGNESGNKTKALPRQTQLKAPPKAVIVSYAPAQKPTPVQQVKDLDQEIINRASKLVKVQADIEKLFSVNPEPMTRDSHAYHEYRSLSMVRTRLEMELATLRAKRDGLRHISKR